MKKSRPLSLLFKLWFWMFTCKIMWTRFGGGISDIAHTISEGVSCQLILLIFSHFFEIFEFWVDCDTWLLPSEIVWALPEIPPPKNRRVRSHRLGSVSSFFALFSHGFRVGLSEIMILCAPLRASETPHFRALSRLMRVALCAANDFPRTVFNLQSNVARAFQIGPHRPVNELESVCSKKNDKIVKIVIENLA